ncbi:MAG: MerR family transcriptional regulator [Acidobacteria bacterium]|nr:MAG: MerR family transcriptional regulator [Acidobacteriota bacterium]
MQAPAQLRPRKLLQSWKEIAGYLGVTVRTVQRWEKEASLPIHRQGTGRRSRVVAYSDELDSWLRPEKSQDKETAKTLPAFVWYASIALVVLCAAIGAWFWFGSQVQLIRALVEGNVLKALDERDSIVWQRNFPSLNHTFYTQTADTMIVADLDGDGENELLFNLVPTYASGIPGRLLCYGSDGRVRWEFSYGGRRAIAGRNIDGTYVGLFFRIVQAGDRRFILTSANHHLWFPAQVALLDPSTGKLLEEYWHPGGIFRLLLRDLDRDGVDEILLGGLNNPGQGLGHAALAVLKIPFSVEGRKPGAESSPFFEFTQGKEAGYVLFPRLDLSTVEGKLPLITEMSVSGDNRILVRISTDDIHAFYYLDFDLKLVETRFTDNLVALHDRLTSLGLLDHKITEQEIASWRRVEAFPTAPDGNSPEVVARLQGR